TREGVEKWTLTSPSSGAAPAATPPPSALRSSARRSPASSGSPSSAAPACALKEAEESFAKFGVEVGEAKLDFATSNAWKAGVVKQMTSGVAGLFKAN